MYKNLSLPLPPYNHWQYKSHIELIPRSLHSNSVLCGVSPPNVGGDSGVSHNRKRPPSHIDAAGEKNHTFLGKHSLTCEGPRKQREKKSWGRLPDWDLILPRFVRAGLLRVTVVRRGKRERVRERGRERKLHGLKRKLAGKEKSSAVLKWIKGCRRKTQQHEQDFRQMAKNGRRPVYFPQRALVSRCLDISTNLFYKPRGKSHNCITRAIKSI